MVAFTDAVVNPGAMVVKLVDAMVAKVAVATVACENRLTVGTEAIRVAFLH